MSRPGARGPAILLVALALTGCAGFFSGRFPAPEDFERHAREADYFELHWSYRRPDPAVLEAQGIIVNRFGPAMRTVTLELASFDRAGKPLHRRRVTPPGWLDRFDTLPFTIRLPLNGEEASFMLRVYRYDYLVVPDA